MAVVSATVLVPVVVAVPAARAAGPTALHVNFQPGSVAVPSGYTADTGAAFNGTSGWQTLAGVAQDMTANSRVRNSSLSPDKRYDTLLQMQETAASSGNMTPGRWVAALADGAYNVTVAVGDATAFNSSYEITAQPGTADATTIVDHYVPSAGAPFRTVTKLVNVAGGQLVLDPTGGTNTKLDFVDAVPAGADTTAPTVSVALDGSLASGTTYTGPVGVTATTSDNVGVTATSFTVDGGASTSYTGRFVVSATGTHTVVVRASDAAGNVGSATSTFTVAPAAAGPTSFHVNFGAQTTAAYPGYVLDYGLPYTASAGMGWEAAADGTALSLVGNGRERNLAASPDKRYDTQMQMQETAASSGVKTPGQWEHAIADGTYQVTVAVGDASAVNSVDRITAEPGSANAVVLVNNFVPTTGAFFSTVTVPVTVSDGRLTLSPTGGSNTKIDFVDVVPATATDTTPPTASVALAGTLVSGSTYSGAVTATVTSGDEAGGSGLKSTSYTLDGGAVTPYTTPIQVSAAGPHTITVTATDNAGNVGHASATFTIQAAPTDTTPPTASISLAGTSVSAGVYQGTVTVTVASADEAGGSGLKSTTYTVDGGSSQAYTAPFPVTGNTSHTVIVTATDNAGNVGHASATFTIQAPPTDTTPPTASVALAGTLVSGSTYSGAVTATVTSADEAGGSGLASTTYTLDGGAVTPYTTPIQVSAAGSHTIAVTATDNAGNVGHASATFTIQAAGGTAKLTVTSPDDVVLANPSTPRLVFSAVRSFGATPAKAFTFTNNGTGTLFVTNLAIGGANADNWRLATGQATSVTIAPGASAQVSLVFTPTDPTGCASTASPYAVGDVDRFATLTYTSNDPAVATGSDLLSGVNSCYAGGNNEPVLDQLLPVLGYTDVVDTQYIDRRFIGPLRSLQGTDEIQSPYFTAAVAGQPVSVTPIAHYGGANTVPYQATGWYAQGSAMTSPASNCTSACNALWQFPADPSTSTYNQNQKLLPTTTTGVTTFTPTGVFGLFSGGGSDVNFSDDGLNVGHTTTGAALPVPHYLHDMRVYPAYGPGHVAIPNTYIVGIDVSRVPSYKNNDYQDVILLVRNVQPAVSQATVLTATNDIVDLTKGGTVTATCGVTGFDGVLANTGGTQCNAANIGFTTSGLQLTSTAGQLANSNQQNALYKTFDATRGAFTIDAQVVGPVTQLTTNYQQIGAFFGPDQSNFLKVEAEHNGTGDPHLTMFYDVKGVSGTVATVAVPALTTATTLDLIIKGNTNVPDPLPYGDTYGVHGFPLDELTVYYSINGATPVQIGTTTEFPADVTTWFSRAARAGILNSNTGTTTSITTTFSKFSITAP